MSRPALSIKKTPAFSWRKSLLIQKTTIRILAYTLTTLGAGIILTPFFWMVSSSLKPLEKIFEIPVRWLPDPPMFENYINAWNALPFTRFFGNTLTVTALGMLAEIASCTVVAYGFARFRFPGKKIIFIILLSTMMLPYVVTLIPTFLIWRFFRLINTYDPLVIGALFAWGPFNVFLIRQFMMTIPTEMEEAARIDGASIARTFLAIMIPLIRPALLVVGIFTFQAYWNDFLKPLIYLNDMAKYTMTLGMFFFVGGTNEAPKWHWLMAMTTLLSIPIMTLFFIAQRYFIEGIAVTGLKS